MNIDYLNSKWAIDHSMRHLTFNGMLLPTLYQDFARYSYHYFS